MSSLNPKGRFGTLPVFLTAISTILGAILFLRFGFVIGNLGFYQTILVIIVGHLVTIPTAMAIAEIATNQKVEGGGEYFIISRSFGLNIGSAIGTALYFSQAISVAFYIIAFGEAFEPVIQWLQTEHGIFITKKIVSLIAMALLGILILTKGASLGMAALYVVVAVLFVSLVMFFAGTTGYTPEPGTDLFNSKVADGLPFFYVFAICFPAFTGMTAGVGLSGDLKNPKRSIPLGTLAGTIFGMLMYVVIAYKLTISASPEDLATDQFVMGQIALWGPIIPIGLACATVSSALGSILVAPRTLQAIGKDYVYPSKPINDFLSKGRGKNNEPFNAALVTIAISFGIIAIGNVDFVAEIITMFFMVTYGSLCMISFLHHFNADPSYRPAFRSRWYISLLGAVMCIYLMFRINAQYAFAALCVMVVLYLFINYSNQNRRGVVSIFQGVIFQLSRSMRIYLQKSEEEAKEVDSWRPSIICVTENSFDRLNAFDLVRWISARYGFGSYIHQVNGYYSKETVESSKDIMARLKHQAEKLKSNVYLDTIISPSYTSAIAQCIQLPGVSGKNNNMVLFEFWKNDIVKTEKKENKENKDQLKQILENFNLVKAGHFDVCILGSAQKRYGAKDSIHIWIKPNDVENSNLMILIGFIISGHPEWKNSVIKIFSVFPSGTLVEQKEKLVNIIQEGRLPISINNITVIEQKEEKSVKEMIAEKSIDAALTIIGFNKESIKNRGRDMFEGYDEIGDVLFVNSSGEKVIK